MTQLLFLFSMPRAGSTWLQRILASNSQIHSAPETWLLLPLFEVIIKGRALTEYNQSLANSAINGFFDGDEAGQNAFHRDIVRQGAKALLARCQNGEKYFLEKTPRNHLFCNLAPQYFPDSRSIFLWRDPAEIALSIARTWGGKWDVMFRYEVDFVDGLHRLIEAMNAAGENCVQVRYHDLVHSPDQALSKIYTYLEIENGALTETNQGRQKTQGRMGDQSQLRTADQRMISRGERASIRKILNAVPEDAFALAGVSRQFSMEKLFATPVQLFEPRDVFTPFARMAYRHQLGPDLKRLRGEHIDFPRSGVE